MHPPAVRIADEFSAAPTDATGAAECRAGAFEQPKRRYKSVDAGPLPSVLDYPPNANCSSSKLGADLGFCHASTGGVYASPPRRDRHSASLIVPGAVGRGESASPVPRE